MAKGKYSQNTSRFGLWIHVGDVTHAVTLLRLLSLSSPRLLALSPSIPLHGAGEALALFGRELYGCFNDFDKPQWREVAQYVDAHAHTNDLVLPEGRRMDEKPFDRYSKRTDIETERAQSFGATEGSSVETRDSVWVVSRNPPIRRSDLRLADGFFEETHTPVEQERYHDLDLTLYERN